MYFQGKFTGSPTVLVTLEHQRDGLKHDAASVWVEDISSSSFQVCIRELQNFDGIHEEIDVVRINTSIRRLSKLQTDRKASLLYLNYSYPIRNRQIKSQ